MAATTISYPLYIAETASGTVIAGPSTDCQRMMIAATTWERLEGAEARVIWWRTLTAEEAQLRGEVRM